MKIVFVSNYLSEHQLPFSLELVKRSDCSYKFIATQSIDKDRMKMGKDDFNNYNFVIKTYESNELLEQAKSYIHDADVVLFGIGCASFDLISSRIKQDKLTFIYSERIYKKGFNDPLFVLRLIKHLKESFKYKSKNVYLLSASAYAPFDFGLSFRFKNKCFKWGYFPETINYDSLEKSNTKKLKFLWVGRMLELKHPEHCIDLALKLRENKVDFDFEIVGEGPRKKIVEKLAIENNLNIKFTNFISSEAVRVKMTEADVFLLSSDFNEGWGAVLNEAMNAKCVVLASYQIGSVPYLLKHLDNGYIYDPKYISIDFQKFCELCKDRELLAKIGNNAYTDLTKYWTPQNAVDSLLSTSKSLLSNHLEFKAVGPCSKAYSYSNNKMKSIMKDVNFKI